MQDARTHIARRSEIVALARAARRHPPGRPVPPCQVGAKEAKLALGHPVLESVRMLGRHLESQAAICGHGPHAAPDRGWRTRSSRPRQLSAHRMQARSHPLEGAYTATNTYWRPPSQKHMAAAHMHNMNNGCACCCHHACATGGASNRPPHRGVGLVGIACVGVDEVLVSCMS